MQMFQIGDWVTQYSVGYWQVVDIKAKYAEEDSGYGKQFLGNCETRSQSQLKM